MAFEIVFYLTNDTSIKTIYEPFALLEPETKNYKLMYLKINVGEGYKILDFEDFLREAIENRQLTIEGDEEEFEKRKERLRDSIEKIITTQVSKPIFVESEIQNFENFREGYLELYKALIQVIKDNIKCIDELSYHILAGYLIFSWVWEFLSHIFGAKIPFLIIKGESGSGKTTLCELLTSLSLRGKILTNPTGVRLARFNHLLKTTIIIDDLRPTFQKIGESKEASEDIFNVLRAGINIGACELRFEKKEGEFLAVYGPKIINSNVQLPEDVENRGIRIYMEKAVGFVRKELTKEMREALIRRLYALRVLLLTKYFNKLIEIYKHNINALKKNPLIESRLADLLAPIIMFIPNREIVEKIVYWAIIEKSRQITERDEVLDAVKQQIETEYEDFEFDFENRTIKLKSSSSILDYSKLEVITIDYEATFDKYCAKKLGVHDFSVREKLIKTDVERIFKRILRNNLNYAIKRITQRDKETGKYTHTYKILIPLNLFFEHMRQQIFFDMIEEKIKEGQEVLNLLLVSDINDINIG